jgi:hypothetical protein
MRLCDLEQIDHFTLGMTSDGHLEPTSNTDDFYGEIDLGVKHTNGQNEPSRPYLGRLSVFLTMEVC